MGSTSANVSDDQQKVESLLQRTHQHYCDVYLGSVERLIKAFFLCNGGGVIAVLSYWHLQADSHPCLFVLSLILFISGLLASFLLVIGDYFLCDMQFQCFYRKCSEFSERKLGYEQLIQVPANGGWVIVLKVFGWIAGVSFFVGSILGLVGYLRY